MSTVRIPCPKCGKELRLRDRSLLGKRGRCPGCQHTFLLEEPAARDDDEVELELADPVGPAVGTSAKWIPDNPPARGTEQRSAVQSRAESAAPPASASSATAPDGEFFIRPAEDDMGGAARLREIKRRAARRRNLGIVIGGLVACAVTGAVFAARSMLETDKGAPPKPPPAADPVRLADKEQQQENTLLAQTASPTRGEPIDLKFIPAGARIVVHLRPAELWEPETLGHEVRSCLGPLAEWAEAKIKEICEFEPAEIEEALICLLLGSRGTPPEVAAVVRLAEEQKKSELILKFQGERVEDFGYPVYVRHDEGRAFLIHDLRTIAVCPSDRAGEMAEARNYPMPTAPGIEELIRQTDRQRHLTVLFEPHDARIFQEFLAAEDVLPLWNHVLDRFSDDEIETIAWSVHLGSNNLYSQLLLRNQPLISPARLSRNMHQKLEKLPLEVLRAVEKMEPQQAGPRRIIGRFPAMTKAFSLATLGGIGVEDQRYAQLVTVLPERAAPNLAVGALLTWHESLRTDFSKAAPPPQIAAGPQLPDKLADRLRITIDMDFNRTPLDEVIDFIAGETKVPIEIDGDALKFAAYTKNMPQTFSLGRIPATEALAAIFAQYDKMCLVVDEQKKTATVMTYDVAEKQGVTPFVLEAK